uniref:protein-serine/threonine phosphatase n=1 Tax=Ananas comosus var. bracteatus TaxID=296719 RepID=A0A6V7QJ27_ANACO|nr:unnamed protein product [Ananas comosus var. bracteatus]
MKDVTLVLPLPFSMTNSLCNSSMDIDHLESIADAPESLISDRIAAELLVEGGDGDDLEVRTLPGSDEEDSTSIGPEQSVLDLSCNTVLASSSGSAKSVSSCVEIIEGSALGKLGSEIVTIDSSDSDSRVISIVNLVVQDIGAIGSSASKIFLLNYIPLWGSTSICGRRPEMEDAVVMKPWFCDIPIEMLSDNHFVDGVNPSLTHLPGHFFGVYDGHGGSQVANYCRERIHTVLIEEVQNANNGPDTWQKQWEMAFTRCFVKVDDEVGGRVRQSLVESTSDISGADSTLSFTLPSDPIAPETVGSTAVVAVICSSHIIVANCGDSRAVLCRGKQPVALSVDHKPDREDEYARIEAAGGKVIQWNGYRVYGVLAMSRSIGDRYLKPSIIPDPEVTIVPRTREDECLILASDGLWDVMSNEEACDIARRRILLWHKKNGVSSSSSPSSSSSSSSATSTVSRGEGADPAAQAAADYLSRLALQKGSKDNITVIVVDLKAQRKFKSRT